jgi:hypothetical protein
MKKQTSLGAMLASKAMQLRLWVGWEKPLIRQFSAEKLPYDVAGDKPLFFYFRDPL